MLVSHAEPMPSVSPTGAFLNTLWPRASAMAIAAAEGLVRARCGLGGRDRRVGQLHREEARARRVRRRSQRLRDTDGERQEAQPRSTDDGVCHAVIGSQYDRLKTRAGWAYCGVLAPMTR